MSCTLTSQITERQSASWQTPTLRIARSLVSKLWFPLVACFVLAVLLVLQVIAIGVLDRLGVSPQFSFLGLNLALVATLAMPTLYPLLRRNWALRSRATVSFDTAGSSIRDAAGTPLPQRLCKVLIIRRLETNRAASRPTAQTSYERTNPNAIVVRDWFSGS